MESRLNELEAKISLAEDLLDALNYTVFRQQQLIDRLQRDVRILNQQSQQVTAGTSDGLHDEIPPHY